jgi:hypothetical protein
MLLLLFYALSRVRDEYAVTARSMLVVFAIGSLFAEPLTSLQASAVLWIAVGAALSGSRSAVPDLAAEPGPLERGRRPGLGQARPGPS